MEFLRILSFDAVTALPEIIGRYLPLLVLKQGKP